MEDFVRHTLKTSLRKYLLGDENKENRAKLIKVLGITDSTIKSWTSYNNNGLPVSKDLPHICDALHITLNQLFGIEDEQVDKAMELYKAYLSHPEHQASINQLLGIK